MNSLLTFGEWLRQRREELGLTRKEFARRVGCSVSTLRKIEDGERHPSVQIAELIANCLDIPSAEHLSFVKVARGELGVDRLSPVSKLVGDPNISPASIASAPRSNLPALPTPLIGRQHEMDELIRLLRDPQCRLLTLVGPGGIGKTRLAIETASGIQDIFPDGVYFIPFASVNTMQLIVPVIADAVGFVFQGTSSADPKTQLFNYLKQKQVLLLADNLEHLLTEPGIEVLAELLANAPRVNLLATSRESLRLQGEWTFEVHGLPVPENPRTEDSTQDTSIELFLQRARRAHVEFNATSEDLSAILRICRLVDGMPLAIELAAAWVRTLTCNEIAKEIERGLDFLRVSTRDIPPRHRSMRAVFDHSWKLLNEEEQEVLAQLSIFRGGFTREAAEQVAQATLPMLSAFVTKSLIRRSGAGRYDLHELVRQYAADRLADQLQVWKEAQERHGNYYLAYFGQADGRLRSSAQRETLAELTAEMDNFRAAWDWAVTHSEFVLIEQSLRTIGMLYHARSWWQEGVDVLGSAIKALETACQKSPTDRTVQTALGHMLASCALLSSRLGQHTQAQTILERSLEILRPLNEPHVLVEAITFLGTVMELTGNYARASELYSEGLEVATAVGDRWFAAFCRTCLVGLDGIAQTMVKPEVTYERLQSVVADWRAIGDHRFTAIALNTISWIALRLGRYDEARAAQEESISLNNLIGDRWGLGFAFRGLGLIAQAMGEHQQAIEMYRKSLDILTELGARQDGARVLAEMSRSVFALGNDSEAERGWRESLGIAIETRGMFIALESLAGIASLQAKRGEIRQALELLLIVQNHPSSIQETKDRAAHLRVEMEAQLTPEQIETILTRAGEKNFDSVVEELLE